MKIKTPEGTEANEGGSVCERGNSWKGLRRLPRRAGLVLALAAGAGCTPPESVRTTYVGAPPIPVRCEIFRGECMREAIREGIVTCDFQGFSAATFVATACPTAREAAAPDVTCRRQFCEPPPIPFFGPSECRVLSATVTSLPVAGVCAPDPTATGPARATFSRRSRTCQSDGSVCTALVETISRDTACVDVSTMAAVDFLPAGSDERERSIKIIQFEPNSPACLNPGFGFQYYTVPPGPVASVSGATSADSGAGEPVTANLTAVGGVVVTQLACDVDGGCRFILDRLRLPLANTTVAGVALSNLVVRTAVPAPLVADSEGGGTTFRIRTGDLRMTVEGRIAGGPRSFFNIQNRAPVFLEMNAGEINLSGQFTFLGTDAIGRPLPFSIDTTVRATPAPPSVVACLQQSPRQRLFGFEEVESWSAPQASLVVVGSPVTQGCGALAVSGQGYMTINGGEFSTRGLAVSPAASVDLFIPGNQPNPYWLGALQLYLTCPSANFFNQYVGQVELTGRPTNQYATLRFPLPSAITSTLRRTLDDCRFSLALNVNQTNQSWLLDNLRFTN